MGSWILFDLNNCFVLNHCKGPLFCFLFLLNSQNTRSKMQHCDSFSSLLEAYSIETYPTSPTTPQLLEASAPQPSSPFSRSNTKATAATPNTLLPRPHPFRRKSLMY
jgi:hypothetical protein